MPAENNDIATRVSSAGFQPTGSGAAPTQAAASPRPLASDPDGDIRIGEHWGRYVVVEVAGHGAMGWVVRAFDPKLSREVALKRLRSDALDPQAQARLVREAKAMAQLSHPNVVAVYDVDRGPAGLLLAMEYVHGETLRKWLGRAHTWQEIVDVFVQAGRGLAAAHNAALVHRDFKPANVLVSDEQVVKVTDFGLAKSAGERDSQSPSLEPPANDPPDSPHPLSSQHPSFNDLATPLTQHGAIVGTPRYMAPERWDPASKDSGAAADQYSLCVALWEALVGEPPFGGSALAGLAGKQEGPPPWPKAARVPKRISRAVMRGLAADPAQRWPSVAALLAQLVDDGGRRRRLVGAALVLASVSAAALGWWGAAKDELCTGSQRALESTWNDERAASINTAINAVDLTFAGDTALRVEQRLSVWAQTWIEAHRDACEATNVRGEQSSQTMELRMACLADTRRDLAATVHALERADAGVVRQAVELVHALPAIGRCGDVDSLASAEKMPTDPDAAKAVEAVRDRLAIVRALHHAGKLRQAQRHMTGLLELARSTGFRPLIARVLTTSGVLAENDTRFGEARDFLLEALETALVAGAQETAVVAAGHLTFVVGYRMRRLDEGLTVGRTGIGLARRLDPGGTLEANLLSSIASTYKAHRQAGKAVALHRQSLAIRKRVDPPLRVATALNNLGNALTTAGEFSEAQTVLKESLQLSEQVCGPDHPGVAKVVNNLGVTYLATGELDRAEPLFRRSLRLREQAFGPQHGDTTSTRNNLAAVLMANGDVDQAVAMFRVCAEVWEQTYGAGGARTLGARANAAAGLKKLARHDEAVAESREVAKLAREHLGPKDPATWKYVGAFAFALADAGHEDKARPLLHETIALIEGTMDQDLDALVQPLTYLASIALNAGDNDDAFTQIERALSIVGPQGPAATRGVALRVRSQILLALDRPSDALADAQLALVLVQRSELGEPEEQRCRAALSRAEQADPRR